MKKLFTIIFALFSVLVFTGWTSRYEIDFENGNFSDKMIFNFASQTSDNVDDEDFRKITKEDLINNGIYTLGNSKKYNTAVEEVDNESIITLSYKYKNKEFQYNNFLRSCFDEFNLKKKSKYYLINIKGSYKCDEYNFQRLYLKSDSELEVNNDGEEDEYVYWDIKEDDNDINITIYRNGYKAFIITLYVLLGIITFMIVYLLIKFYKSKKM